LADKLTPLILQALARAAAEPGRAALLSAKGEAGLFPATVPGKAAAQKALDAGWLAASGHVTEGGLAHLVQSQSPKVVLEDLVRVLEARDEQVRTLLGDARAMAESLAGLRSTLAALLPKVASARVALHDLPDEIMAQLAGREQDCPLPELHRALSSRPSLGTFHDALRNLHRQGRLYLHPYTGPLYTLPEPAAALLVGHEVAYYASARARVPVALTA
jgi:hypothetical protein